MNIKFWFSVLWKMKDQNVNTVLNQIRQITYQSNLRNRNINTIATQDEYQTLLKTALQSKELLTVVALGAGLYSMRKIAQQRRLTDLENELKEFLVQKTDLLVSAPINILVEGYANLVFFKSNQSNIINQLQKQLRDDLFEKSYINLLEALAFRILDDNEIQLLQRLQRIPIEKYTPEAKFRIFYLYSSIYNLELINENLENIYSEIKDLEINAKCLGNVFEAYQNLPQSFDQYLYKRAYQQFEDNIKGWKSQVDLAKIKQFCYILTTISDLGPNSDMYLKEFIYQSLELKQVYQSSLDQVLSVYMFKITNENQYLLQDIWKLIKMHDFTTQTAWEFMAINHAFLSEQLQAEFKESYFKYNFPNKLLKELIGYRIYKIPYTEIQDKIPFLNRLNESFINDTELTLKVIQLFKAPRNIYQNYPKSAFFSIRSEEILQFWSQFQIKMNFNFLQEKSPQYPFAFNKYQIEFLQSQKVPLAKYQSKIPRNVLL